MAPQPQDPELSEPRVKDWGGSGAEERNMALPLKSSRNSNQICRSPRIWLEMETHGEFECMSLESERMKVRPEGMMLAQKLRYPCRDSSVFLCILLALRTLWMRVWALVIFSGGRRASSLRVSSSIPRNSKVDAGPAVLSWARGRLIFAARCWKEVRSLRAASGHSLMIRWSSR